MTSQLTSIKVWRNKQNADEVYVTIYPNGHFANNGVTEGHAFNDIHNARQFAATRMTEIQNGILWDTTL